MRAAFALVSPLLLIGCASSPTPIRSASVGVRCGDLDLTVISASRNAVMVELKLRGRARAVGEAANCRMTIERAELAIPASFLASLRGSPDPARPVTATTEGATSFNVEPGDVDVEVVTFELDDAVPVADEPVARRLAQLEKDGEMLVVLDPSDDQETIVQVVQCQPTGQ